MIPWCLPKPLDLEQKRLNFLLTLNKTEMIYVILKTMNITCNRFNLHAVADMQKNVHVFTNVTRTFAERLELQADKASHFQNTSSVTSHDAIFWTIPRSWMVCFLKLTLMVRNEVGLMPVTSSLWSSSRLGFVDCLYPTAVTTRHSVTLNPTPTIYSQITEELHHLSVKSETKTQKQKVCLSSVSWRRVFTVNVNVPLREAGHPYRLTSAQPHHSTSAFPSCCIMILLWPNYFQHAVTITSRSDCLKITIWAWDRAPAFNPED